MIFVNNLSVLVKVDNFDVFGNAGSPRVEGDDDEEDVDDIEHEFNIEDDKQQLEKNNHITEAMLHGKMTYGRGLDDEENSHYPPVIAGGRATAVCKTLLLFVFM